MNPARPDADNPPAHPSLHEEGDENSAFNHAKARVNASKPTRLDSRLRSLPLQLLEQALDGRQPSLQLRVLGLNPVDVGVQDLDLARSDARAGEVVEGGARKARVSCCSTVSERLISGRPPSLGAHGGHLGVQIGKLYAQASAERSQFGAQGLERKIGHKPQ
jgi:hypothetical protein